MAAGTEFAIDKIKNAFTSLLGKQPFSKIKTVDIIRVSGVSHQTFYRLFLDKYNLAETAVFELLWSFQAIYGPNATWKDTSYSLLAIILNNKEYFKNLVTDLEGTEIFLKAVYRISRELTGTSASSYTSHIWLCTIREWIIAGYRTPIPEVYHTLCSNLPVGDILSGKELERAISNYEQLNMTAFKQRNQ